MTDDPKVRAVEAAEVLLSDFSDKLNPEQYARALAVTRIGLGMIHPEQAKAVLRLYDAIAGHEA